MFSLKEKPNLERDSRINIHSVGSKPRDTSI
jgi:hypothetical protein